MRNKTIDLLSLDVEGFESTVLSGLDFNYVRPRFILVECLSDESRNQIDELLLSNYDFIERFSYRDFFYRTKSG